MKTIRYLFLVLAVFQTNAQISDFDFINFQKADSIALVYKNETLSNLPELTHKLTAHLATDVERFRAIYMWVCGNIANDYVLYSKNMRKRQRFKKDSLKLKEWNNHFRKIVFQKLLEKNRTICTGYAYLVEELSQLANINCKVIHGFAKTSTINLEKLDTPNHSWNAVELNGKWYLCDPTWASGIPNPETLRFEFYYNDGFFLSNPKLFAVNHYPIDEKWLLINDNNHSFKTFLEAPIIYGEAYTYLNVHDEPKRMHNTTLKNDSVVFKYDLKKNIVPKDVTLLIDNGSSSKKVHPQIISKTDQSLVVAYAFKHVGFYDVHFYIGDHLISTYTFKVKKPKA